MSATGIKSLNQSLYDFLLTVRSNRVELRVASELFHKKPPLDKSLIPFTASKPKSDPQPSGDSDSDSSETASNYF